MAKAAKDEARGNQECFFITPIGNPGSPERRRADFLYKLAIIPSAKDAGLTPARADLVMGSAMIGTNIFKSISEAAVCVADLTGGNENVFYELGVRHSLKLPIVHIAQDETKLPFDNAPHLTHFYDLHDVGSLEKLRHTLAAQFKDMLSGEYEVSNPFTQALGNIQLRESGDTRDQVISDLLSRLGHIEARLSPPRTPRDFDQLDLMKALVPGYLRHLSNQITESNAGILEDDLDLERFRLILSKAGPEERSLVSRLHQLLIKHQDLPVANAMLSDVNSFFDREGY